MADAGVMAITGASQGLGRALAGYFGGRGWRLLLAARNEAGLQETARRVEDAGGESPGLLPCDLRDPAACEAFHARLAEGPLDVLVNNAADVTSKPLLDTTLDEIDSLFATNVTAPVRLARLAAPGMAARGGGVIVNVSSLAGYKANPAQTAYSASKAALNGASEALRVELAPLGIAVVHVALPSVGDGPGQVSPDAYARVLERAIARRTPEVFLSPVTRALMRLYAAVPAMKRLR